MNRLLIIEGLNKNTESLFNPNNIEHENSPLTEITDIKALFLRMKNLIDEYINNEDHVVFITESEENDIAEVFDDYKKNKNVLITRDIFDIRVTDILNWISTSDIIFTGLYLDCSILKDSINLRRMYPDKNMYIDKDNVVSLYKITKQPLLIALDLNGIHRLEKK